MSPHHEIKLTALELVYPPISSQEAVWIEQDGDSDTEQVLRSSDFYMIVGRADATYRDFNVEGSRLCGAVQVGLGPISPMAIDLALLLEADEIEADEIVLELGDKCIRVSDPAAEEGSEPLQWFTLDKLAWDKARALPGLDDVDIPADLVSYDLLYIGIAKVGDSYNRLFKNGHKARAEILSNETQRHPGARVSDEIFLLLFRAQSLFIRTFDVDEIAPGDFMRPQPDPKRIVADLEKALISQMLPPYNRQTYQNYPLGSDGLRDAGLDRYGYVIAENLTLRTAAGDIRGSRDPMTGLSNGGDMVAIDGDIVAIIHLDETDNDH